MKHSLSLLPFAFVLLLSCTPQPPELIFSTDTLKIGIDEKGFLTQLQDIDKEFELEPAGDGQLQLREVKVAHFHHEHRLRQPGEPLHSAFTFESPEDGQPVAFLLSAEGAAIEGIRLELDNYKVVEIPGQLAEGEVLWYKGGDKGVVYSANWKKLREVTVGLSGFLLREGPHELLFDCTFIAPEGGAQVRLEWRLPGVAVHQLIAGNSAPNPN